MPFILLGLFLLLVALSGGASRPDAQSQLIVRVVAIVFGCLALLLAPQNGTRTGRAPLFFLATLAALMALQLVPLPPEIWTKLPGRELISTAAPLAGLPQPWRPISITPDLTINSLMALLPAIAALLLFRNVDRRHWFWMLVVVAGLILLSGLVGLAQVSGKISALYLYRVTNYDTAVGLFANRNHQALLLSMMFPLMAALAAFSDSPVSRNPTFRAALLGLGLFFLPLILVAGSRAGLVLSLIGIAGGVLLYLSKPADPGRQRRRGRLPHQKWLWIGGVVLALGLVFLTISLSKAEAVQRLFSQDIAQEKRYLLFWPMVEVAKTYFPVGAGFGSFADVFRIHEPFEGLSLTYMNHAHNDLVEVIIEAGAAGAVLLAAFLAWLLYRSYKCWSVPVSLGRHVLLGRLGSINVLMVLLASLADYPVRTPTIAVLFVLSLCWLSVSASPRTATDHTKRPL